MCPFPPHPMSRSSRRQSKVSKNDSPALSRCKSPHAFLEIKSRDNVWPSRDLHLQSGLQPTPNIRVLWALLICFSKMTFQFSDNGFHYLLSAVIFMDFFYVVLFSFFPQREALLLVLVRFDAFALTLLGLNMSFAGARRAIPREYLFGSANWRWREELLGNQGHTHHTWKGADDLCLLTMLCPSALPSLTAHQK